MATVSNNVLVNGLSGKLGKTLVFKIVRGKTIVCSYTASQKKQTVHQQINRERFKVASAWAKTTLLNLERKEHYHQKAKELKLPNAYTAAIKYYMSEHREWPCPC
jgi:hypothetical protein